MWPVAACAVQSAMSIAIASGTEGKKVRPPAYILSRAHCNWRMRPATAPALYLRTYTTGSTCRVRFVGVCVSRHWSGFAARLPSMRFL